jgi:hypothetical protein
MRGWWYTRGWILGNSGPLRRGFQLWRSNPSWHMHPVLVEDCKARGVAVVVIAGAVLVLNALIRQLGRSVLDIAL